MQFSVGQVLGGRYTVKRELGRGGVGVVYLCADSERREDVALKLLLPQFSENSQAVARFKREVQAVRILDHPGIIKIYDTGSLDSTLFYTMEFLDGEPLRAVINRKKRLKTSQAVYLARAIAEVLTVAHPDVVHRDLSPENVLIRPGGTLTLLDFGQAKIANRSALTIAGVALGKDVYGAPEQMEDASTTDFRADFYALGVILAEMLTGVPPLKFSPIHPTRPDVHPDTDVLLEKLMAQSPDQRHASTEDVLAGLRDLYATVSG